MKDAKALFWAFFILTSLAVYFHFDQWWSWFGVIGSIPLGLVCFKAFKVGFYANPD